MGIEHVVRIKETGWVGVELCLTVPSVPKVLHVILRRPDEGCRKRAEIDMKKKDNNY